MHYKSIIPCIYTEKISESRDFYLRYFNGVVTFDCGWYVNLRFGSESDAPELALISPQESSEKPFNGKGLVYNLEVDHVDDEYARLTSQGLSPVMPIEDHLWGDRGFAVQDPNGVIVYIYTPIEPSDEFKQYYTQT